MNCEWNHDEHCITCSDEVHPYRIVAVDAVRNLATVTTVRGLEEIDITLVNQVVEGDVVLVHGGVAIERLAEA